MATILKRKDKWYAQIRRKGIPSISRTFRTREKAEEFARKVESELDNEIENFSMTPNPFTLPVSMRDLHAMFRKSKDRARNNGTEHTLTEEEFMQAFRRTGGKCEVSGLPFSGGKESHWRVRPYYPSIDRIDASKGYTADNVRFVAAAVNIALSDFGESVLKAIAFGIVSQAVLAHRPGIDYGDNTETQGLLVLPGQKKRT